MISVFDRIAKSWHAYRQEPMFPEYLEALAKRWKKGKLLDIGCGNCRNLAYFKNFELFGIDISRNLLNYAKRFCEEKGITTRLIQANALALPFKNETFDYVISIATLHHLKDNEITQAVKEMHRVMKENAEAFVTLWQKNVKEAMLPWEQNGKTYYRYYRFYTAEECMKIFSCFRQVRIEEVKSRRKNLFLYLKK